MGLNLSKASISVLPAFGSTMVILATLFAAPHFNALRVNKILRTAFILLIISDTGIFFAPRNMLPWLFFTVVSSNLGTFLFSSLITATIMNLTKKEHWPHLISLNVPLFNLAGFLAGPLIGRLYTTWPRAPFLLSAGLTVTILILIFSSDFSPKHIPVPAPADVDRVP